MGIHKLKYLDLEIDFNKKLEEIDSKIVTENNKGLQQYNKFDARNKVIDIITNIKRILIVEVLF